MRRVGGVAAESPRHKARAVGLAFGDLGYNGGPTIACPQIFVSFWGATWSQPAPQAESQRLVQFLRDLCASPWMNILSQYGAGTGQKSATVAGTSFVAGVSGNLSDGDVHTHLQAAINSGAIPAPPAQNTSEVVVIFLDESIAVRDPNVAVMCELSGDNAFGYHNYFKTANGNNCYYAVVPALDNNCIIESCPCQNQIGNNTTASTPFVTSDDFVFFQGTDNKLWKVKSDGSSQMQIGHNTTKSTPFVTGDGWVWFQGTDNKLWKVFNDGTQQSQPGNNTTSSSPFVSSDGWVYFQGTDNKLWRMRTDGSGQVNLGGNTTASAPTAIGDSVYFRGTDNALWRFFLG